jgi:hypothetical protein
MDTKVYIDAWPVQRKSSCGVIRISNDIPINFPSFGLSVKKVHQ